MNKYMLKFCLFASIANVSAASYSQPDGLDVGSGTGSQEVFNNEPNSPFGHHVSGGAAGSLIDRNNTSGPFPSALSVTYDGHETRFEIDPNMTVFKFRNVVIESLKLKGGYKFILNGGEIMVANVDADGTLITLEKVFSKLTGIPEVIIQKDASRSPMASASSSPAPQDTTPPKAPEPDPAVTE